MEVSPESHIRLTPRELHVLDMMVEGHTSHQIASQLGITEGRVEQIRRQIRDKFQTDSNLQVFTHARKLYLLKPERDLVHVVKEHWEAINARDRNEFAATMHEGCTWKSDTLPQIARGRRPVRDAVQIYFDAFPDLTMTNVHLDCYGNQGTVFWIAEGTHRGEFLGIPPTLRHGRVRGCTRLTMRDGRIDYMRDFWDMNSLLEQLGITRLERDGGA